MRFGWGTLKANGIWTFFAGKRGHYWGLFKKKFDLLKPGNFGLLLAKGLSILFIGKCGCLRDGFFHLGKGRSEDYVCGGMDIVGIFVFLKLFLHTQRPFFSGLLFCIFAPQWGAVFNYLRALFGLKEKKIVAEAFFDEIQTGRGCIGDCGKTLNSGPTLPTRQQTPPFRISGRPGKGESFFSILDGKICGSDRAYSL